MGEAELTRDLSRPEAYGRDGGVKVEARTTHASRVFLVGDDVWKVKRPVELGFLDFRTIEARQRFCEEEVRLNRRLAQGVYLGVEPVRETDGRHRVGDGAGAGEIVDWAVHMRRLPEEASAEAMLAAGTLGPARLGKLAERLAPFFAEARATPELGAVEVLRGNVDENFSQVAPFVDDLIDRASFDEVRAFQLDALETKGDRFAARVAAGRVREGHGDLRLEHVYFLPPPDGVVAIDCIEFNERFRCGDVAGEAAFLAMELEAAHRHELANGFLARFAEATDDFGLYGVVDFYLSYRAWVRGKVASFLASDPRADGDLRSRKREEARRDFALARAIAGRPLDAPFVVVVSGAIGSGKSTLAEALGHALAAPVVSSDRTRKAMAGLAPTERGGPELYAPEAVEATYVEVLARGAQVLASGRGVILDATFSARRWRTEAADLARRTGARFVLLEARCADREVLRARLAARRDGPSVSDATDAEMDDLLRRFEPLGPGDPGPRLAVDTSGGPGAALDHALGWLGVAGVLRAPRRPAS